MIEYLLPLILAVFVFFTKTLDYEGIFAATIFSYIILLRTNVYWLYVILTFFVIGSIATRFKMRSKKKFTDKTRTISNVIANGIIAIVMALIGQFYGFIGAVAAACGDTLSSEIGMLSKQAPIMITTLRKAKRGMNGAITFLGLVAATVGGALVGLAAWPIAPYVQIVWVSAICGLFGSLFDSYLGATLENKGYLGNFGVNLMATAFGALIGIVIFVLW